MPTSKRLQRQIGPTDLADPLFLRIPHEVKPTALGLWIHTDVDGRRELVPELIAADLYPGQAAVAMIEDHLLILAEIGFLTIYQAESSEWIEIARPLKADRRGATSECPAAPNQRLHGIPRNSVAVGGARERVRESVREQDREHAAEWAEWERQQEQRASVPKRPLLMDAPSIGCPEHPNGRFGNCGPCGTARRRHDLWVARQRYDEQIDDLPGFDSEAPVF